MTKSIKDQKGFSLVGMLLSIAIITLVCYFAIKVYFREPSFDEETKKEMAAQGIDSSSKPGMIRGAKDRTRKFNKGTEDRLKQFEQIE